MQNNTELRGAQPKEMERNWAVSSLYFCLGAIFLLASCRSSKRYMDSCGYEVIHHPLEKNAAYVPLFVHGKVTVSGTGKKAAFAILRFESKKGKVYETKADKRGFYSIKFEEKYFDGNVSVTGSTGSFKVEDVFFGYSRGCEFNIRLFNYDKTGNFVELDKNAIISIRDMGAKQDSLVKVSNDYK